MLHFGLFKHHQSGFWHLDIPPELSQTGARWRPSTGSKDKVVAEGIRKQEEELALLGLLQRPTNPNTEEFQKQYLSYSETNKNPKTTEIDERVLKDFFKYNPVNKIGQVTRRRVEQYLEMRTRLDRSPATVDQDRRTIHAAFEWARKHRLIGLNPASDITPRPGATKPRRITFSDEALKRIFAKVTGNPRHRQLWHFLLYSGMRITETLALQWDHIDDKYIEIHEAKGDHGRTIPITNQLYGILQNQTDDYPYVFGGVKPYATRQIAYTHLKRSLVRLGINLLSPPQTGLIRVFSMIL